MIHSEHQQKVAILQGTQHEIPAEHITVQREQQCKEPLKLHAVTCCRRKFSDRRRSRLSPASTACFHGVSNRIHSSSRTHSSSLNKCLHKFEGHSPTSMLLSCWRIKLGSNPKGSHSISTNYFRSLRRFMQSIRRV